MCLEVGHKGWQREDKKVMFFWVFLGMHRMLKSADAQERWWTPPKPLQNLGQHLDLLKKPEK